ERASIMQILVVEDDIRLAQALGHILEENNYQVDLVGNGELGLDYGETGIYDVIILDVMLPKMNGFDVVAELRRRKVTTPVLMLTARDAVPEKITGLDSGADDYMTKPFSPAELLAHLRALTRRQGEVVFETVAFEDIVLNLESFDLSCGKKTIHLGLKEFSILKILMINPTQVISKETLIAKVWGVESSAEDNNVEAYISFLRKKLKFVGSRVIIETLRKAGYRLGIETAASNVIPV
ncbi:MAG: response regulator transcription factor, partial [Raoultibacter sp.]